MIPSPDSAGTRENEVLAERVDALATWLSEIETRLRAAEVATGDEKTAKELRRAIQALSKHDPKLEERVGNRVDVLADRLATLASTVSTTAAAIAAKDGELTALRRELDSALVRIESMATRSARGIDSGEIASLRKEVATLATERSSRKVGPNTTELARKLEYLGERIDTLAATVSTTAAGLAGREGDLAQLRRATEETAARLEMAVADLRRTTDPAPLLELKHEVSQLAARGAAMDALRGAVEKELARLDGLVMTLQHSLGSISARIGDGTAFAAREDLEALDQRLASLGEHVQTAAAGVAAQLADVGTRVEAAAARDEARGVELTALARRLDEANERAEAVATELRSAIAAPREPVRDAELDAKVAELATSLETAAARAERIDLSVDTALEGVAAAQDELRAELGRVSGDALARADQQAGATRSLQARLDAVAVDSERTAAEVAAFGSAVRARLDALESSLAQTARTRAEPDPGLEQLRARFDDGVARVDTLVGDLRTALDAAAAGTARTAESHELLAERIDALATRVAGIESETGAAAAGPDEETIRLRFLVEELATRLEHGEQELAALRSGEDAIARLAELAARLDAVEAAREHAPHPAEAASGEGRFRLELRGLELRMQHAEEAARENREAVLTQLERLASKIEWRLQRLEGEEAEPSGAASAGAQVVPIRGPEV